MTKPTPLRPGAYYHLYGRGNNRQPIFREARNYPFFLQKYTEYVVPIADTFAYCLLPNHFHFLVWIKDEEKKTPGVSETPGVAQASGVLRGAAPSHHVGTLLNSYAKAFNKLYGRSGSLFRHPFGRREVASEQHLTHLVRYIHRNPQTHGLVDDFRTWRYSSYRAILATGATQVRRDEVLDWFPGREAFVEAHSIAGVGPIGYLVEEDTAPRP